MATAEWETYALTGRFKSKRRRKRLAKEGQDKKLVQLFKEFKRLRKQQWDLGYMDLIPPVQKGWKRYFILRPDVMLSKDKDFFLELLEKINTTTYSHRKDFKHKRRRHGKKVDVDRIQNLQEFFTWQFEKLKLTEREKMYFKIEMKVTDRGHLIPAFVFTEPWRYVLRIRPNMITKVKIVDPELKSREKQIDNYFEWNKLYPRLFKVMNGTYGNHWLREKGGRSKYKAILKRNPLDEIND